MRILLSRLRAAALAAALVTTPALVVTAAPVAAHASIGMPSVRLQALAYAKAQLGDPYRYGAAGPNAFDCSGLTMRSYGAAGKAIGGHSATAQYRTARDAGRLHSFSEVRRGDLLFYGTTSNVYHVAMYAGDGRMVEAAHNGVPVRIVAVRKTGLLSRVADPKG